MSWQPVDLSKLSERPQERPTLGGCGLVYPGKRHIFSGPQESAKTLAAYIVALGAVRDEQLVALVDLEMGPYDARDRLRELGANQEELGRLLYIEPDSPATEDDVMLIVEEKPVLVVIDAAAGAYGLHGLDDNKRADVERFAKLYVQTFWLNGIATILIDHVVKNAEARGKYAIGSERKVGGADVHLGFEAVLPLVRGGHGLYKVTTHKDRAGFLPRPRAAELELRSDPETHAIAWTLKAPEEEQANGFRPTALMERVSRYLEEQAEPVSRNATEEAVIGKRSYVRLALEVLLRDQYVGESAGERGARLVRSLRPFREGDLAPTSPRFEPLDLAPTSPQAEPLNHADLPTSPHLAPTSPLAPDRDLAPTLAPLQGGRGGRGEVVDDLDDLSRQGETNPFVDADVPAVPLPGDDGYPELVLAVAAKADQITTEELGERMALHELVQRVREAQAV